MRSLPIVLLLLSACGESLVVLDEALVAERLDWISEAVPLCQGAPSRAAATSAALGPIFSSIFDDLPPPPDVGSQIRGGSCGGGLWLWTDHARGNTDYVATFEDYCVETRDGPLVLDGVFEATEHGTPTDSGPLISAVEVRTAGPVDMTHDGEPMSLSLDRTVVAYGNPSTWSPDPPTEDRPDQIQIRSASITMPDGKTVTARNVRLESTSSEPAMLHVRNGDLILSGEGRVGMRTDPDAPIAFDLSGVNVFNGTLELRGARGTVLEVTPRQGQPGTFDLAIDGTPFDQHIDCGLGVLPFAEIALALTSALPAH